MSKTLAWTRSEGKDQNGGLNAKGVASYRKANPGSNLKTGVDKTITLQTITDTFKISKATMYNVVHVGRVKEKEIKKYG